MKWVETQIIDAFVPDGAGNAPRSFQLWLPYAPSASEVVLTITFPARQRASRRYVLVPPTAFSTANSTSSNTTNTSAFNTTSTGNATASSTNNTSTDPLEPSVRANALPYGPPVAYDGTPHGSYWWDEDGGRLVVKMVGGSKSLEVRTEAAAMVRCIKRTR